MTNDLDTLCAMLDKASVHYEVDADTYASTRILVRTYSYDMKINRDKVTAIFDFTVGGELLYIS